MLCQRIHCRKRVIKPAAKKAETDDKRGDSRQRLVEIREILVGGMDDTARRIG